MKKLVLALLVFFSLPLLSAQALVYTYENGQTRVYVPLTLRYLGSIGEGQYMTVELYGAGVCLCPWGSCCFVGGRIVLDSTHTVDIRLEPSWTPTPCITGYDVKLKVLVDGEIVYEETVQHIVQSGPVSVLIRIERHGGYLIIYHGREFTPVYSDREVRVYVEEEEQEFSSYVLRGGVNVLDSNCGINHQTNIPPLSRVNPKTFWDRVADAILGGLEGFSQIPTAITLVLVFVVIVALMALTARLRG